MPDGLVLHETLLIDSLNGYSNAFMTTDTLRTFQMFEDFDIIDFKDCFEVNQVKDMTALPTMFETRLLALWAVPSKLQGREEIYLEDETPFECWLYVNSWRLQVIDFKEEVALVTCCTRKHWSRKSSAMFVSLLVTGESLAWT